MEAVNVVAKIAGTFTTDAHVIVSTLSNTIVGTGKTNALGQAIVKLPEAGDYVVFAMNVGNGIPVGGGHSFTIPQNTTKIVSLDLHLL